VNYELREYPQALNDLTPLAAAPLPADLRIAVLILQGEAAYQSGDHAAAGGAFRRVLLEFPDAPQTPLVRLAAAWTSLRQGRSETARREFLDFVRISPDSPYAPDALVLAAALATEAGELAAPRGGRVKPPPPRVPRLRPDLARQPLRSRCARARRRAGDGGRGSRRGPRAARSDRADVPDAPTHRLRAAQPRHPARAYRRHGGG